MGKTAVTELDIPTVLSRNINGVIYNLMVRTITDNVYDANGYTLTEIIQDISKLINGKADGVEFELIKQNLEAFFADAPEDFRTLMDIYYYINSLKQNSDEQIIAVNKILSKKVNIENYDEDKRYIAVQIADIKKQIGAISTGTVTEEDLTKRLSAMESELRKIINKNVLLGTTLPSDLVDGGFWIKVEDTPSDDEEEA